jgi:hypothetical protein
MFVINDSILIVAGHIETPTLHEAHFELRALKGGGKYKLENVLIA